MQSQIANFRSSPAAERCHAAAAGQALVELAVGLVVLMVLMGAVIQLGRLMHAHAVTLAEARALAGAAALSSSAPPAPLRNEYIYNWLPGADGCPYTRDDVPIIATAGVDAVTLLVEQSAPLGSVLPSSPPAMLGAGLDPVGSFALVSAEAAEDVEILPVIRRLVYRGENVHVENSVWLVWTGGIY